MTATCAAPVAAPGTRVHETTIVNPLTRGQAVRLPAGVHYRHRGQNRVSRRTSTVVIKMVHNGWVDVYNDHKRGCGFVVLPEITWAGAGGYWSDVRITPELAAALGITLPPAPTLNEHYYHLDVEPTYGPGGYDNRLDQEHGLG